MTAFGQPYQGKVTGTIFPAVDGDIDIGFTPSVFTTLMERPASAPNYATSKDAEKGWVWNQRFLLDRGRLPDFHWVYIDGNDIPWLLYAEFSTAGTVSEGSSITATVTIKVACQFGVFEDRNAVGFDGSNVRNNINYYIDQVIASESATFYGELLQTGFSSPLMTGFSPNPRGNSVLISWQGTADEDTNNPNFNMASGIKKIGGISKIDLTGNLAFNDSVLTNGVAVTHTVVRDCDVSIKRPVSADYNGVPLPAYLDFADECDLGAFYDESGNQNIIHYKEHWENRIDPEVYPGQFHKAWIYINGVAAAYFYGYYYYDGTAFEHLPHGDFNGTTYTIPASENWPDMFHWGYKSNGKPTMISDRICTFSVQNYQSANPVPFIEFHSGALTAHDGTIYKTIFDTTVYGKYFAYDPRNQVIESSTVPVGYL